MMMTVLASSSTSLSPGHPNTHPDHLTAIQAHLFVLSEKKSSYRVAFPPSVHPPSLPCWENQFKPSWGEYLVSCPGPTGPFWWFWVGNHLKTTLGWLKLVFHWDFFHSGWCGVWVSDLYQNVITLTPETAALIHAKKIKSKIKNHTFTLLGSSYCRDHALTNIDIKG